MLGPYEDSKFYHDIGLSLIFLPYGEKRAGEWKEFQTRRKTLDEIRHGCRIRTNIALVMGRVSGNIAAVDADSDAALEWIKKNLPESLCGTRTANGEHRFYRLPEGIVLGNRARLKGLKLDLRAEGGYVLAAPSKHPSGFEYMRTGNWSRIHDSPVIDPDLFERNGSSNRAPAQIANSQAFVRADRCAQPPETLRRALAYASKVPGAVSGEGGHKQTFALACKLVRNFDLSAEELCEILKAWNVKCVPPWSERELAHKSQEAIKAVKCPSTPVLNERRDMTAALKNMRVDVCSFCQEKKIGYDLENGTAKTFFCSSHAETAMKGHYGLKPERKKKEKK